MGVTDHYTTRKNVVLEFVHHGRKNSSFLQLH